jgi:hypothetical protein
MTDLVLAIRLTADGKGLVGEVRGSAEELKKLGQAAQQSNDKAKSAADQYIASLKRQAETLGMTKSQTLAYEASQLKLTEAQRDGVAMNIRAIESHERQEVMFGRVRLAAAAAAAMIGTGLAVALRASVTEAARAEQAHLKLEAVLLATGHAAGLSKSQLDAQAEGLKRSTGFDDDQIRSSMALMLTFKQVQGDTFGQAMVMATNLSKLIGQDLQSSVLMLGKALEDPESGLLALRRAGVSFNDSQKDAIKGMVEFGDQARALEMMLRIMREQGLEGVAEKMNTGYVGAMNNATNATADFLKMIGNMSILKGPIIGFLDLFADNLTDIKNVLESGDWVDTLALFTVGYITPSIVAKRGQESYVGGREQQLAREGAQGLAAERAKSEQEDSRDSGIAQAMGLTPRTGEGWQKLNEYYMKQHEEALNKLAEAEKQLQAKGVAGWIAYADAVFDEAFGSDRAQAAIHDDINKRETLLEEERTKSANRANQEIAQKVANIYTENQTELDELTFQLDKKAEILHAWAGEDLQRQQIAREQIETLERKHQAKMFEIELAKNAAVRNMQIGTWQLAAELLQQFAGKSRAAALAVIAINKGLAIAQVIQNTQVAIMRGYAELGPFAGSANAAAMETLEGIQIGLIAATGLGQALNVGGGGASLGSPANPISTTGSFGSGQSPVFGGSDQQTSQVVVQVIVQGNILGNQQFVDDILLPGIRDAVGGRDAIIIPQNSRQALNLTT